MLSAGLGPLAEFANHPLCRSESSDGIENPVSLSGSYLERPTVLLWECLTSDLLQNPAELDLPELTAQLAMWLNSGRCSTTDAFQQQLQACCLLPGGPN